MKIDTKKPSKYAYTFIKWIIVAILVGAVGGVVGSLFHICVDYVTETREHNSWIIYLLPIGGLMIVGISKLLKSEGVMNTNKVIDAVRTENKVPLIMAPLIFVSTVITHLFGGSAGREGAALQLGGSIGYNLGKTVGLNKRDMHIVVMAGMSAVFTALFGTPVTATVFSLEVISVGVMYYAALVPCIIASVTAYAVAGAFNIPPVTFEIGAFPEITAFVVVKVLLIAVCCALVSILFCVTIKSTEKLSEKYLKNTYLRAFIGGVLILVFTLILNTHDYNGAGMNVITNAMSGQAKPEAFLIKIVFTAITIAAGFKGGEIVPTFFIGSTFGCVMASVLGLQPGVGAAIGFVAMFCSVVNCPVASMFLAVEVFGGQWTVMFMLACAVSFFMSGYSSLYKSQRFVYSKLEAKFIDNNVEI